MSPSEDSLIAAVVATRAWVEGFVIAEQLCPFAAAPTRDGRVRYVASAATDAADALADLQVELARLGASPAAELSNTLLILPHTLASFGDYNDFLVRAQKCLRKLGLVGEVQLASFHPDYTFAGSADDDAADYTNRSPFPMLHLLREAEVELAIASHPDISTIPVRNVAHLRALGITRLRARLEACLPPTRTPERDARVTARPSRAEDVQ